MLGISNISSFLKTTFFFVLIACLFNTIATSFGLTFPYTTFLFVPEDVFADFFKVMDALHIDDSWKGENAYGTVGINHIPPFAMAIYATMALFLKYISVYKLVSYLIVFIIPLFVILKKSNLFTNQSNYWFLILFSYPVLQILSRGNLAGLVFVFLTLSILNIKNILVSMFFLALAVSLKITPIIFIAYFVIYYHNNIKRIVYGSVAFILLLLLVNYISIEILSFSVSKAIYDPFKFFSSIRKYEDVMVYNFGGLSYGSSFYMAFRSIFFKFYLLSHLQIIKTLLSIKPLIINLFVVLFFLAIYFLKHNYASFKALLLDKHVVLKVCSIIFILFTPVTADYYLAILFLPLFFVPFSLFGNQERVLYLLLLIPKNYFFFHGFVSIQVYLNPLLLLLMLIYVTDIYRFSFFPTWIKEKKIAY